MSRHMNRHFNPYLPIEEANLSFANGASSIIEMVGFTICDPGDVVLLSRPIYHAFKLDLGTRAG